MNSHPEINGERLLARLDMFAKIGATPGGGVNRQALTPGDREARALLTRLAKARSFSVFQDDAANLFIRMEGRDGSQPPLLIGSHLDSQPSGGRFDGALGTLTAFEVLESLADAGVEPERPVEVVAWTNEEGCRFAPGCMGSRAFVEGKIPAEWADLRASDDGARFEDERLSTIDALAADSSHRRLGFPVAAYLELHIEQGPSLESEEIPIGIVTGVQGTRWLEVAFEGQTAHAGTTALQYRRDPLKALTMGLSALYAGVMPENADARFTVGRIAVAPGSVNAIPATASCTIDLRHPETAVLDRLEDDIRSGLTEAAARENVSVAIRKTVDMEPVTFSSDMVAALQAAAQKAGLPTKTMISGAFHDALFVAGCAPSAMIFVPCRDGLSHNEAEYVKPEDSVTGARMFLASVLELLPRA
ncbi:Zn-dependent hydrolase [Martelella radicis]|uniref:N-carbamoyl-L-amino-acid hydrolase n=1 Tax=Martelella radicis TaxID=1397476 RepID=A0A7W6KMT1_9HYPH|nr:Zn-dependent hydrolase [Martelella radicis]MBB4124183.1 N-carbamoyl-L-amino-acid hydrolase [Martelella radicis]